MRDMWQDRCTILRPTRSKNIEFQRVAETEEILVDEPCVLYSRGQQVVTPDGVVWRRTPRLTVSPLDGDFSRPRINDKVFVNERQYLVTDFREHIDYDSTYLGTTMTLSEVGFQDAAG